MSKLIATSAIRGAHAAVKRARAMVDQAIKEKGPDFSVAFPNTAYFLPIAYSHQGIEISTLGQMQQVLSHCDELLPEIPSEKIWLPYLGATLDAGMTTLFAFELIEACKTVIGPDPIEGIWLGAADDVIMRERGVEFVDGSAPGFAAVVGCAPDADTAVKLARELQSKNLYVFMAGNVNGVSFAEQLASKGVQLGWDTRLVPFGKDTSAAIHALGFASRAALSFGGVKKGDYAKNLKYNKNRIFAFVLALGEVDDEKYAAAAGCINYGFPTIANTDIPQILPSGICTYEHVVSNVPVDQIVNRALEVRGCKIKITEIPIPVSYGAAFEGERIRKEQVQVEFGGSKTPGFEFCTMKEMDQVEDGKITVVGPEADQVNPGSQLPIGIWVEVAGRKMQPDFEPILERQIHHMINQAEGIWHMGQRDINWIRISIDAFKKGFRIKHFGEILRAKMLGDYPAIVDKVAVTIFTDASMVEKKITEARKIYRERNLRLESLTDDSVDIFYSCLLCQSFAPNHVCVITPERLGLCGAYNWLDGKAAYEIDPTGPNQPLAKGECLDPVRGIWGNINDYVFQHSNQSIDEISLYSIMNNPMTSCGCFEVILAVVPELNGVIAVNREFTKDTPVGMKFSTLAGTVGGGQQTPGFMGCGKVFLTSRKFLATEGGIRRLVWMPKQLKDQLREDLQLAVEHAGCPDLLDKIADESVSIEMPVLRKYLEDKKHPALELWDVTTLSPQAVAWDEDHPRKGGGIKEESKPEAVKKTEVKSEPQSPAVPTVEKPKENMLVVPTEIPSIPAAGASVKDCLNFAQAVLSNLIFAKSTEELKSNDNPQLTVASNLIKDAAILLQSFTGKEIRIPEHSIESSNTLKTLEKIATEPKIAEFKAGSPVISMPSKFKYTPESFTGEVATVTLGGSGTRKSSVKIGGAKILPFRHMEGLVGNKPAVAMEVFDRAPDKFPKVLRDYWGSHLSNPADMARLCVEKLGAQVISVRLDGCHPDKGNKSPQEASEIVKSILSSVGVPLIITGPAHYEKNNEVMKKVAADCAGENLLLNWAETDNYRTIAGAAMGYGHCIAAQTPIDVNMAKQLNILLTTMGVHADKIVIDPMTGALGYGLEYSYSVMERIRIAALTGDQMLQMPMLVTAGFETAKCKEANAENAPLWGDVASRGALLETAATTAFLNAGADLLIMYYPDAVKTVVKKINEMW